MLKKLFLTFVLLGVLVPAAHAIQATAGGGVDSKILNVKSRIAGLEGSITGLDEYLQNRITTTNNALAAMRACGQQLYTGSGCQWVMPSISDAQLPSSCGSYPTCPSGMVRLPANKGTFSWQGRTGYMVSLDTTSDDGLENSMGGLCGNDGRLFSMCAVTHGVPYVGYSPICTAWSGGTLVNNGSYGSYWIAPTCTRWAIVPGGTAAPQPQPPQCQWQYIVVNQNRWGDVYDWAVQPSGCVGNPGPKPNVANPDDPCDPNSPSYSWFVCYGGR
jgi:hypothetical protein